MKLWGHDRGIYLPSEYNPSLSSEMKGRDGGSSLARLELGLLKYQYVDVGHDLQVPVRTYSKISVKIFSHRQKGL